MPHYILKIATPRGPGYLDWSTIVDAPASEILSRAAIKRHWIQTYGTNASRDIEQRLKDADQHGTDHPDRLSVRSVIEGNRAGPHESELSLAQIVRAYSPR